MTNSERSERAKIAKNPEASEFSQSPISSEMESERERPVGRFAPSPSGRMHLGNIFTALLSWLSVKARGGKWILRIEDLDPQRSKPQHSRQIEEDLLWLGLTWDEGGLADVGPHGPYSQSRRFHFYEEALQRLHASGLTYPCRCTRADIMATQAPHQSDGRIVYSGRCRPAHLPRKEPYPSAERAAVRLAVEDENICFEDLLCGPQSVNLAQHCGDFILRRADGAWAYMLAVVVDDALMGVNEVMRGHDLLLSAAQQIYLHNLLGYTPPRFVHLPLICNAEGRRLSKRDASLSMEELRRRHTPESLIGELAHLAGLIPEPVPITLAELLPLYDLSEIPHTPTLIL